MVNKMIEEMQELQDKYPWLTPAVYATFRVAAALDRIAAKPDRISPPLQQIADAMVPTPPAQSGSRTMGVPKR